MKKKNIYVALLSFIGAMLFVVHIHADTLPVYDMSEWQGQKTEQQFQNVKAEVSGLIIRRQYGSNYIDKYAAYNTSTADKVGVPYGEYAYAQFVSASDAKQEAKDFYNRSDKNAKFYALDYEEQTVSSGTTQAAVKAWLDEMRSLTDKKIIFYSYRAFSNEYVGTSLINQFDGYWLAAYQGASPTPANYDMWQSENAHPSVALATKLDSSKIITNRHSVAWWFGSEAKSVNKKLNSDNYVGGFTKGETVTLNKQATYWYTPSQEIASSAKGQTYTIKDTKDVVKSRSNQAVLLYKNNIAIGWALAEDVTALKTTTASNSSGTFKDGNYTVTRETGVFYPNQELRVFAYPGLQPTGAKYYPGEPVKYDGYVKNGDFVYISYDIGGGYHHYIAARENGVPLGTFK